MIDSRIEYWYKVIDLVIEHVGTVEILSKEPVGDSVLRILEETLKNNTGGRLPSILENQAKGWEEVVDYLYDSVPNLMSVIDENPHSDSITEALKVIVKSYKQQQALETKEKREQASQYWKERFSGLAFDVRYTKLTNVWIVTSILCADISYTADNEEELADLHSMLVQLEEYT